LGTIKVELGKPETSVGTTPGECCGTGACCDDDALAAGRIDTFE